MPASWIKGLALNFEDSAAANMKFERKQAFK
jgi:hypothetical protein